MIEFARNHLELDYPLLLEIEGIELVSQCIDQAVASFRSKNQSCDCFGKRWASVHTL